MCEICYRLRFITRWQRQSNEATWKHGSIARNFESWNLVRRSTHRGVLTEFVDQHCVVLWYHRHVVIVIHSCYYYTHGHQWPTASMNVTENCGSVTKCREGGKPLNTTRCPTRMPPTSRSHPPPTTAAKIRTTIKNANMKSDDQDNILYDGARTKVLNL